MGMGRVGAVGAVWVTVTGEGGCGTGALITTCSRRSRASSVRSAASESDNNNVSSLVLVPEALPVLLLLVPVAVA